MPIETICSGCGKTLRVGNQHAGKQAQCPECQALTTVPAESDAGEPAVWRMRTPEGQVYGPIAKSELDRWMLDGRVASDCELQEDSGPWRWAESVYGELTPTTAEAESREKKYRPRQAAAPIVSFEPAENPVLTARYVMPHRGGLLLTLGILCWMTCPVFSVFAWVLGVADQREMRLGRMDPAGLPMTQAGLVLGLVNSVVWMLVGVISIVLVLLTF